MSFEWDSDAEKFLTENPIMLDGNPDNWTMTGVKLRGKGFTVEWFTKGSGFGSVCFYFEDGVLRCENEAVGPKTLLSVFEKLIETAKMDWVPGPDGHMTHYTDLPPEPPAPEGIPQ